MTSTHSFNEEELLLILEGLRRIVNDSHKKKMDRTIATDIRERLIREHNQQVDSSYGSVCDLIITLDNLSCILQEIRSESTPRKSDCGAILSDWIMNEMM